MGAGSSSRQRLGERAAAAQKQLASDEQMASERVQQLKSTSPETLDVAVKSLVHSLKRCSPFSDSLLLLAFAANPEETKRALTKACKKVLSAPIRKDEYEWFLQHVFPSTVWMMKGNDDRFLFEDMLFIVEGMTQKIDDSMNSIYEHLKTHRQWQQLTAIANQSIVERQDDDRVGLLKDTGVTNIAELKEDDESALSSFVDTNLGVTSLTATAKRLNGEFQQHMRTLMNRFGDFRAGPTKSVARCQSKLENEYQGAEFPKAAKLLDLVRCSVSFNTLEQLLAGYEGLMRHIQTESDTFELARVKNDFLKKDASFRAIKVNVVYHSQDPLNEHDASMVCEVQLVLNQFLFEKKRMHKLYSILRERAFFEIVIKAHQDKRRVKNFKQLQFEPVLNAKEQLALTGLHYRKAAVDSELGLLALKEDNDGGQHNMDGNLYCVNLSSGDIIFETPGKGCHTHHWLTRQQKRYLSLQTAWNVVKMFEIDAVGKSFDEDESLRLCLGHSDKISYIEFDRTCEHIVFLKTGSVEHIHDTTMTLELRAVDNINETVMSIELDGIMQYTSRAKQMALSDDGTLCAVGGGWTKNYFHLIDLQTAVQHKMTSKELKRTYLPCFINGKTDLMAMGDEHVEIWDIKTQRAIQILFFGKNLILGTASTNNILAVATLDGHLGLWNVLNWEKFFSKEFSMEPLSLYLSADLKYLTIAGNGGEKCIVMEIK